MLSILIPVYKQNITLLVNKLYTEVTQLTIEFEILAYEDGSKSLLNKHNQKLNTLAHCSFKELPKNIGRSAIRNLLANNSKFETLLFIDAGTFPKEKNFIKNYIALKNKGVIHGGMTHSKIPPKAPFKLRWVYTKKRERCKGLHSCNFLIQKSIFKKNYFDESLKKYGYEDVLFFNTLQEKNILIHRIENPVIHNSDDDANTFLKKNENAIENLILLIKNNKIKKDKIGISKYYYFLKKNKLNWFVVWLFKTFKPLLKLNLNSSYPSLFLYDFYRLGYFCLLKNKK